MADKKRLSRELKRFIKTFFKGSRVIDEEAFAKAMRELNEGDRAILQDLRGLAFDHEDVDKWGEPIKGDKKRPETKEDEGDSPAPDTRPT